MSLYTRIIDLQKLGEAWKRVRKNHPSAGVDEVTCDDFETGSREYLKQLHIELKEQRYTSLPVKLVPIYKGEKVRQVSLYCMRDKVVQQSIAQELVKMYDCEMSEGAYAYRPGRAALQAIEHINKYMQKDNIQWILKTDIASFFDEICLKKLYGMLGDKIREPEVLSLIQICCEAPELQKDGELHKKEKGIYQGMGMSPVLSNIYLMDFDKEMTERCMLYVRYSDDILILGNSKDEVEEILEFMRIRIEQKGLFLNEKKTSVVSADIGVEFLGYRISSAGKVIPAKAEQNLEQRLEDVWLTMRGDLKEKLRKGAEILGGWEQYYKEQREIGSIQEYVVVVYMIQNKSEEVWEKIREKRKKFNNPYKEICQYLVEVWRQHGNLEHIIAEYEQLYELESLDQDIVISNQEEICEMYKELLIQDDFDLWTELMQRYSDEGAYNKASKILERIENRKDKAGTRTIQVSSKTMDEQTFVWSAEFIQKYMKLFAGREDTYGREEIDAKKKRCVEQILEPLTEDMVKYHLDGSCTLSTYLQRSNMTVKYLVIDIDISKRHILKLGDEEAIHRYLPEAAMVAHSFLKKLKQMGLKGYLEDSGYRGYHIWLFFTEWIPTRYVIMLTDILSEQVPLESENVTVEYLPNKTRIKAGSPGQAIKLPLGFHIHTGNRSTFLTDDLTAYIPKIKDLADTALFSLNALKRIIGMYTDSQTETVQRKVDLALEEFGELPDSVSVVLKKCNLMRYLCQKARTTGYLSHFERLSVLYVFAHLGEDGKNFVHTVMEFTLNYQYHVTEKFIQKLPAKPISCLKLRDQYKQITAEYGCSCNFRRTKNCYPSPVLHAIKSSGDEISDVTIPTSRTLTKHKEQEVVEELNIHKKVKELTEKIVEMKRQRRGVDKVIQKSEAELGKIFDQAGIDCLEMDMGMLVRRKKDDGYEWIIEI